MNLINTLDYKTLFWIENNLHNRFLDGLMSFITTLGDIGLIWIIISILLLFTKKYRVIGILTLSALLLNALLGEGLLKNLVQRPRPFITHPDLNVIVRKPSSFSFPSGHTSSAFAAALMLGNFLKKYRWYMYIFAGLTAFSRVYLLVHYPTDVIGGIILGIISYIIVYNIYIYFSTKKSSP